MHPAFITRGNLAWGPSPSRPLLLRSCSSLVEVLGKKLPVCSLIIGVEMAYTAFITKDNIV